jgi:hypothetical protein
LRAVEALLRVKTHRHQSGLAQDSQVS